MVLTVTLGLILLGCAPSGPQATPTEQAVVTTPTTVPVTPTEEPSPVALVTSSPTLGEETVQPSPTQRGQAPTPTISPTPFAVPHELPTKGSPDAKVVLIEFSDYL